MMTLALLVSLLCQDATPSPAPKDELADELKAHWTKALELCRGEKKEDLEKLIAAMEFTKEELVALFGEEKGAKAHERYQKMWKDVLQEAPADLIGRCKKSSWEEVEVWCLNTTDPKDLAGDDKGVLGALVSKDSKVYNIRLKAKGKKDGFALRCFVKTKDGWRMGLKMGRALADR